jgi:hypothetical protein
MYSWEAWAGSVTLTAQRCSAKWSVNKLTYNEPATGGVGVTGSTASVTVSGVPAGTLCEIDVTSMMQTVASGAAWYGLRVSSNTTSDVTVHSAQSPTGAMRPVLVVTWSVPLDEPDGLRPAGSRVTSVATPFLAWNFSDDDGDAVLQAVQVQFGSSQALLDAGTATFDTGTIPATEPNLDLSLFSNQFTDPSFEAATPVGTWTVNNQATMAWGTTPRTGSRSLQLTAIASPTSQIILTSPKFPIAAGQPATAIAWFRTVTAAVNCQVRIRWYDATGATISDSTITSATPVNTTTYTTVQTVGQVAPAGTTQYALLWTTTATPGAGAVFQIDDVSLFQGTTNGQFTPLTSGASSWWRVRNQDGNGVWSVWSDSVNFLTLSKGVLTITAPGASITEGSPTVTWTFTGRTQEAYQVAIAKSTDVNNWLWDSGKVTSTTQSIAIPFGVITDPSLTYIIIVRVWDDQDREGIPGDTPYVEAQTSALAVTYSAGVTNVTSTAFASDAVAPKGTLTFSRTSAPDYFQLQQSDDNGTTWYYIDEALPSDLTTGGTGYAWTITTAKMYVSHQWRVLSVVGGVQSQNPTPASGTITRLCPVLMRADGTDACFFMNPERDRQRLGIQGLHERLSGPPVLVTQRLGGQSGHVKGRFIDGFPSGKTAAGMHDDFLDLEKDSGQTMRLAIANETLKVVAFNFEIDTLTDPGGITYAAEFDWIEV